MNTAPNLPTEVLGLPFDVPAERVWARLCDSAFVADYLGATLPPAALQPDLRLCGHDAAGRPLAVAVTAWAAPHQLSLQLDSDAGAQRLHLSLQPCGEAACRLTVLHEPGPADDTLEDALARQLAAEPAPALRAARIAEAHALQLACRYLADSADAVAALARALSPRAGYHRPAAERFSLAEHFWHLADIETLGWRPRFETLARQARPRLDGVDGDRLAREQRYQQRPWRGAARRFVAARRRTLALLQALDAADLARPLVFAGVDGDIGSLLAAMLAHDHEHRLEMAALWLHEEGADQ